jgi:hypothetical protein
MVSLTTDTRGGMEGGGSYSLHARIPAGGGNLASPRLEEAVGNVPIESEDHLAAEFSGDAALGSGLLWLGTAPCVALMAILAATLLAAAFTTRSGPYGYRASGPGEKDQIVHVQAEDRPCRI